jgi:glyoxalase-like protein
LGSESENRGQTTFFRATEKRGLSPVFDHLVVAARSLEEGAAWVSSQLGAPMVEGGAHATMGTHNRLLALGPRSYLEVIAIDPAAEAPGRPRWFALDSPSMQKRLARGPALIHWAVPVDDLEAALAGYPQKVDVLDFARGDYRWRLGVPPDGRLPCAGDCPTLIQWLGTRHPAPRLPEIGCRLVDLGRASGHARFETPAGPRTLAWARPE